MQRLQKFIRLSLLGIFAFLFFRIVDVQLLQETFRQIDVKIVLLAIALYFVNIAIRAFRWRAILEKGGKRFRFLDAYRVTLVGIALNVVIPASMGDVAKSYYGYKVHGIKEEMLATSLVDKLLALCALFMIGMVSGYYMGYISLSLMSCLAAILTAFPVLAPRLVPWKLLNSLLSLVKKSLDLEKLVLVFRLPLHFKAWALIVSLLGWLGTCVYFYVLCLAFPVEVSLGYVIFIMPMMMIARLFPFTVNGIGPVEAVATYFFGLLGIPPTLAVLISLASNIISFIIPGLIGVVIMLSSGAQNPPRDRKAA